jgi:hypothetical protein
MTELRIQTSFPEADGKVLKGVMRYLRLEPNVALEGCYFYFEVPNELEDVARGILKEMYLFSVSKAP